MEKIKAWWYKIVARQLVKDIENLRDSYEYFSGKYTDTLSALAEARLESLALKRDAADIVMENRALIKKNDQLMSEDPLARTINTTRHHASQRRIRDLEDQLRRNNIEPQ